jgi:hypothetical protein
MVIFLSLTTSCFAMPDRTNGTAETDIVSAATCLLAGDCCCADCAFDLVL